MTASRVPPHRPQGGHHVDRVRRRGCPRQRPAATDPRRRSAACPDRRARPSYAPIRGQSRLDWCLAYGRPAYHRRPATGQHRAICGRGNTR